MKKIFRMALVCALAGATLLYTGCTKDYSDDINDLEKRVSDLETSIAKIQEQIGAGYYITDVQDVEGGFKVTLSKTDGKDTKSYTITNGKNGDNGDDGKEGKAGSVVTIVDDYWYIDGKNTEIKAIGKDGDNGNDGATPEIGDNGNWWINGKDTGKQAVAKDGDTPSVTISTDGYWVINGEKTNQLAKTTTVDIDDEGYITLDGKRSAVKAGTVAVWDQEAGTVTFKGINADGSDITIGVCELQSIVFVPQLYLEGIEAAKYNYLGGHYSVSDAVTDDNLKVTDDENVNAVLDTKAKNAWKASTEYSFGEIAKAEYNVNPSSFAVKDATWELEGSDKEYMVRSTATASAADQWSFANVSVAREAGKNAVVSYQIINPHLVTGKHSQFTLANAPVNTRALRFDDTDVSIMRLIGTVNGKKVSSDYEAIVPYMSQLKALAFNTTDYKTKVVGCTLTNSELYATSTAAVKDTASIRLNYDKTQDLSQIIEVHYYATDSTRIHSANTSLEKAMTLADLKASYPDLKVKFELVPYTLGTGKMARQDSCATITDNVFYPSYVAADGTKALCKDAKDTEGARKAIGKKPIVLATVTNAQDSVVLAGYFKIKITNDKKTDFIIMDLGNFAYICSGTKEAKWSDCEADVLKAKLGMEYAEFKTTYITPTVSGMSLTDGKYLMDTYVEDATSATGFTKEAKYGQFYYAPDKDDNAKDKFGIKITSTAQLDSIKKANGVTLYAKFGTIDNYAFVGLSINTGSTPKVTTGIRNPKAWFKPADQEEANLIIINPRVPIYGDEDDAWTVYFPQSLTEPAFRVGDSNSSVTGYGMNLEKAWTPNRVQFEFDKETQEAFGTDVLPIIYHFEFASEQSCEVDGQKLIVKKSSNVMQALYFGSDTDDNNIIARITTPNVRTYKTIDSEGTRNTTVFAQTSTFANVDLIWYNNDGMNNTNTVAKQVLNKYSHPKNSEFANIEEDLDYFLYADVNLVATYGTCDIPLTTETFHVAFFRPLDINTNAVEGFKDAVAGASKVAIGKVFDVTDWQGRKIFKIDEATNKVTANKEFMLTKAGAADSLNWAAFYGVTSMEINIDEVKTNQTGTWKYLKSHGVGNNHVEGVNDGCSLTVEPGVASPTGTLTKKIDAKTGLSYVIDFGSTYEGLNEFVLNYANSYVVQDFEFQVPVSINYWWGQVTETVTIPVKRTI